MYFTKLSKTLHKTRPLIILFFLLGLGGALSCVAPQALDKPSALADAAPQKAPLQKARVLESILQTQQAGNDQPLNRELLITQSELGAKKISKKGPRFTLTAHEVDVKTILLALSKEIDKNIVVDPEIQNRATVDLKEVTLEEALDHLLKPLGLSYTIRDNFIRVTRNKMQTRTFRLNYIISQRFGTSSVQARGGSQVNTFGTDNTATNSTQTSASQGGGCSVPSNRGTSSAVASCEESDVWQEIGVGLQNILGMQSTTAAPASATSGQGVASAAQGDVVGGSVRRRLVIRGAEGQSSEIDGERAYFTVNKQAGLIIVKDYPDNLMKVARFLEAVEGSVHRQVFIEAKVIEVTLSKDYQLGVDWSTVNPINILSNTTAARDVILQATTGLTLGISESSINVVIDALSLQGELSVLSSPKISTLNNQRAIIKVGTDDVIFVPDATTITDQGNVITTFQLNTVTIGLVLDILPQINENGQVMMSINTSLSEQTGERTSPSGNIVIPILDVRESNNVVLAGNGQTIVIGGLMKNKTETLVEGVPLLQDIPYIGRIFQKKQETKEKSELVIMLTPHIMAGAEINDRLNEEGSNMKKLDFSTDQQDMHKSFNRYN